MGIMTQGWESNPRPSTYEDDEIANFSTLRYSYFFKTLVLAVFGAVYITDFTVF